MNWTFFTAPPESVFQMSINFCKAQEFVLESLIYLVPLMNLYGKHLYLGGLSEYCLQL